jgi:hypothetical protein
LNLPKLEAIHAMTLCGVAGASCFTSGIGILFGTGPAFLSAGAFLLVLCALLFRGLNG